MVALLNFVACAVGGGASSPKCVLVFRESTESSSALFVVASCEISVDCHNGEDEPGCAVVFFLHRRVRVWVSLWNCYSICIKPFDATDNAVCSETSGGSNTVSPRRILQDQPISGAGTRAPGFRPAPRCSSGFARPRMSYRFDTCGCSGR